MDEDLQKSVEKLIEDHQITAEALTQVQLAEAVIQAIKAGDFVRFIQHHEPGMSQGIVYIPFRQVMVLERQIIELKRKLERFEDFLNEENPLTP